MINASKEFKEKLKNGAKLANYADINLSDGTVLHLEPEDFMIGGCQIEDKTSDGKFGVGFCIGKTLKIRLENDDERFSAYDFYMSTITIYVAMFINDGTIEKIRKGKYYATVPQTQGDIIEISAVDAMYRLDRPYAATTVYPATLQSIISDICLDCGIPAGFRQFDNYTYTVKEKPENLTYRQVLSYACQVAGYNARIDNDGYMQLIWYNTSLLNWYNYNGGSFKTYPHDTILDGGDFTNYGQGERISGGEFTEPRPEHIFRIKSLTVHTDDVVITGVKVIGKDDVTALFGEEGYAIVVKGNPFVDGKESEVAAYLGGRMVGMAFRPFSAQILGNPLYEPFEVVMVSDRKGNVYNSIINSVSYKIGAYTNVSCQAEDPVRNGSEYISPAVQAAVAEARKNAEKQLTTYDKAVQQMNQLAMNAMGFHTTVEDMPDGSRIVYLHDKPALEDSKTIYKQTIDGFFISTDGGQSYTAGFDKNGNVVVNVLYAIGIVCDWIRGGTLTLGGDKNVNGLINMLDSSGNQIGSWSNDGLSVLKGIISGSKIKLGGVNNNFGSMEVYNTKGTMGLLVREDGMRIYDGNNYVGRIGAATIDGSNDVGLVFHEEMQGKYMCWASKVFDYDEEYFLRIGYFSHKQNVYPEGINLGSNFHMRHNILDFSEELEAVSYVEGTFFNVKSGYESGFVHNNGKSILVVSDTGNVINCYKNIDMNGWNILNTSDERLKKNIDESSVNALSTINDIKVFSFDWISDKSHEDAGFIAQQLESVNENFVDINEKDGHYSTKDMKLIPYLVKSIQELSHTVEELKKEIDELKGNRQRSLTKKNSQNEWKPSYRDDDKKIYAEKIKNFSRLGEMKRPEPIIMRDM